MGLVLTAVLLTASCAGTAAVGTAGDSTSGAPASTAQQEPEGGATASVHPVTTVLLSDDPTLSASDPAGPRTWPGVLAERLADAGSPLDLALVAVEGAGYAAAVSVADLVAVSVPPSTQLVVFCQTRFGPVAAPDVAAGAAAAFDAVEQAAPDALIVVVGPWGWTPDASAPGQEVRDAVREAARGAEVAVTYVDPVAEAWPAGADAAEIADLLYEEVAPLVSDLARSGALD